MPSRLLAAVLCAATISALTPFVPSAAIAQDTVRPSASASATAQSATKPTAKLADTALAPVPLTAELLKQAAPAYKVVDSLSKLRGKNGFGLTPARVKTVTTDIEQDAEMVAAVKQTGLTPLFYTRIISALYASWAVTSMPSQLASMIGSDIPAEFLAQIKAEIAQRMPYATAANNTFVEANGTLLKSLGFSPPDFEAMEGMD